MKWQQLILRLIIIPTTNLKQQPDNATGYFQIGMIQEKLAMNDEALVSHNKIIKLNPDARDAYIVKARIYETDGKFNSAIKEYEKYISVFPDNMFVLIYLGKCYYKTQIIQKQKRFF
jgi:tetratricopeptide (TPR) repeat protein